MEKSIDAIKKLFNERVKIEYDVKKALYNLIEKIQGDKPFIELGDDTFPICGFDTDEENEVVKVRVDSGVVEFMDYADGEHNTWYDPYCWGHFEDVELFYCLLNYAKKQGFDVD